MKARALIIGIPAGLLALAVLLLFVEVCSAHERYVLEDATVLKSGPDAPFGFVGQTERTSVRFDDGWVCDVGGYKGKPGDRVKAYRQRGVQTVFGWFAHD